PGVVPQRPDQVEHPLPARRAVRHLLEHGLDHSVEGSSAGADLTAAVVAAAHAGQGSTKVPKPPACGLHRVDTAVQEAYGTLAGIRTRRRPLPKQMQSARPAWKDWTGPPEHDLVVRRLLHLARTVAASWTGARCASRSPPSPVIASARQSFWLASSPC
ncbi:hypothetical protein PH213_40875, partial [Streptomyces sp. SRF1]|uniref:hypothetical protein n=1 Tax=Streptomyces sp. SRF1 TaxID=1549642 RepID=UPI0025AF3853